MMTLLTLTLTLLALSGQTLARGAGRAFPMKAENYAIDMFQDINPSIEWDMTNYLVDRSGQLANCDIRRGYEDLNQFTPQGVSMGVIYDYIEGDGMDVDSVNEYIKEIITTWVRSRRYDENIRQADRFGCSVRPACRHYGELVVTVACLLSPGSNPLEPPDIPSGEPPNLRSTTLRPTYRPTTRPTLRPTPRPTPRPTRPPAPLPNPKGLAFTPEQYDLAESITGNKWDASHFLENLAGIEATCSMIESPDWNFKDAIETGREYGWELVGLKGQAPNLGSTEQAMIEILKNFKAIRSASKVGCSVIPDCFGRSDLTGGIMWVVVSCIYQEPPYRIF